jgi:hypothetical protein
MDQKDRENIIKNLDLEVSRLRDQLEAFSTRLWSSHTTRPRPGQAHDAFKATRSRQGHRGPACSLRAAPGRSSSWEKGIRKGWTWHSARPLARIEPLLCGFCSKSAARNDLAQISDIWELVICVRQRFERPCPG